MELNLHQLRIFEAVARNLSFSRAAKELYLSQPGVSLQVKALERSLGLELFDQIGKKVALTEAGEELYNRSKRIFGVLDDTALVLEELKGMKRGHLRVAGSTTAGIYVVPRMLGAFHRVHPSIRISLDVANRFNVQERLLDNQVDIGVMGLIESVEHLVIEPFLRNELVVIASPRHRFATRSHVTLEEIAAEPMLIRELNSGTRQDTGRFFEDRGLKTRVGMVLGSIGAIKQGVAADLGIAVVSRQSIALELATRTLGVVDAEGFPIERQWCVVHLKDKHLSAAAAEFKRFVLRWQPESAIQDDPTDITDLIA